MNKFDALKRSQILIRLHRIESELMIKLKPGSVRDSALRKERTELFAALRKRDAELINKWNRTGYPKDCL